MNLWHSLFTSHLSIGNQHFIALCKHKININNNNNNNNNINNNNLNNNNDNNNNNNNNNNCNNNGEDNMENNVWTWGRSSQGALGRGVRFYFLIYFLINLLQFIF